MTDTIDEKLEDLVTILDEDQSAYSTVKLDNFIDLGLRIYEILQDSILIESFTLPLFL